MTERRIGPDSRVVESGQVRELLEKTLQAGGFECWELWISSECGGRVDMD
jgi:hypothetical protein